MRPSSPDSLKKKKLPSDLLRSRDNLEAAWRQVKENAQRSQSAQIRDEVRQFDKIASGRIKAIQDQLRRGTFKFQPAQGILLTRKGKKPRPIVVAPVESRIVQRALLNVVQEIPAIKADLQAGFNFGGVPGPGFGVPAAIAKALIALRQSGYYIRTDIKSFFVHAPRHRAVNQLLQHIDDERFCDVFRAATTVELADQEKHGINVNLFPIHESGVAQGSALSPLLCNYLLRDFDRKMNDRGIVCIRYIDDFILFAPNKSKANAALASALSMLDELGLQAYDPNDPKDAEKADCGPTNEITLLGCELTRTKVRPTRAKQSSLLESIEAIFNDSLAAIGDPQKAALSSDARATYAGAVSAASNVIRGWGNTYAFCSDDRFMKNIDIEIGKRFDAFRQGFAAKTREMSDANKRRVAGLFLLEDCNKDDSPESARTIALAGPLAVASTGASTRA